MKTFALAATLLALGIASAHAQTGVEAGASAKAQSFTCTGLLGELDQRIISMQSVAGDVAEDATGTVGGLAVGLGLSASGGVDTPAGSADASAGAAANSRMDGADLTAINDLRQQAAAALEAGNEDECLSFAVAAQQRLALMAQ